MSTTTSVDKPINPRKRSRVLLWVGLLAVVAMATFCITALLVTIFEHRQESRAPFVRLVEVNELSTDPVPWGTNWPSEYDSYFRTVDDSETQFGGSSAMPASKLEEHPWFRRLYAGYAFSIDYREARGHAYMLFDQEVTERADKAPANRRVPALPCVDYPHLSQAGHGRKGEKADVGALAADFNWPAVMKGFEIASKMDYHSAHAELAEDSGGDRSQECGRCMILAVCTQSVVSTVTIPKRCTFE